MKPGYHTGKLVFGRAENLGKRVKKLRKWYGMSQEEAGVICGVSGATLSRIEAGDDCLVSTILKLCIATDVPPERLFANLPELRR